MKKKWRGIVRIKITEELKDDSYIFTIISNLDAEKVAGYSPKKGAAAGFLALNFIPFTQVAGYSPKKDAADPEKHEKTPLFICFWPNI